MATEIVETVWLTCGQGWVLFSPLWRIDRDEELPWHRRLGEVWPRKDGRYDWWRRPLGNGDMGRCDERWRVVRQEQGVADTLDLAKTAVECGLGPPKVCFRKVCGRQPALYYHEGLNAFYCRRCARKINEHNPGCCVMMC